MTTHLWNQDRRTEQRYHTAGRVAWMPAGMPHGHVGWLSDRSRLSVSFVTSGRSQPATGQEIEIRCPAFPPERFRVTRVAPYDDHLALVACRRTRPRSV